MATRALSDEARAQIAAAIVAAERQCQGEIVFIEAPRSADYARWLVLPVALATLTVACIVHLLLPVPFLYLLAGQGPLAAAFWWFANQRWLTLILVPDAEEKSAVRGRALQLFSEHSLFETDNRAGVLIYVSALERRVEILADRGLNKVIDASTWQRHVQAIVQSIRSERTAQGVCEAVGLIGQRIAQEWGPPNPAKNVLPDVAGSSPG